MNIETKTYPDGTTATGPAPLPDQSPVSRPFMDFRQQVDGMDVLHLLRNPYGHSAEVLRRAGMAAADEIEAWRKAHLLK